MWIFIIIGILIVIGLFSISGGQKEAVQAAEQAQAEQTKQIKKAARIEAYADFLRRTAPQIHGQKSANELNDEIARGMDAFEKELDEATKKGAMILIGFVILGIFFGFNDKAWSSFFILVVMGLGIGYWVEKSGHKRIHRKYQVAGWDIERLKI